MLNHERFRELSALSSVGQLSPAEHRELNAHLRECSECCRLQEDYSRIIFHESRRAEAIQPPSLAIGAQFGSDEDLLDRFLDRARAEGIKFSGDVERPCVLQTPAPLWTWQRKLVMAAAILALAALAGISLGHVFRIRTTLLGSPHCQNCLLTPFAK